MGNATTKDYSRNITVGTSRKARWDGPGRSAHSYSCVTFMNFNTLRNQFNCCINSISTYIENEKIRERENVLSVQYFSL